MKKIYTFQNYQTGERVEETELYNSGDMDKLLELTDELIQEKYYPEKYEYKPNSIGDMQYRYINLLVKVRDEEE